MQRELAEYRQKIDSNNQENETLKSKMNKLAGENVSLSEEVKGAQESLRLSSQQNSKMTKELNDYKERINVNNQESETYRIKIQKLMT